MTSSRIASAGLYALLLIGSSAIWAADAQMKKHCEEMMKTPTCPRSRRPIIRP